MHAARITVARAAPHYLIWIHAAGVAIVPPRSQKRRRTRQKRSPRALPRLAERSCKAAPMQVDAGSGTDAGAGVSCTAEKLECTCTSSTSGGNGGAAPCAPSTFGGGGSVLCCASSSAWQSGGGSCECLVYTCLTDAEDGCDCGLAKASSADGDYEPGSGCDDPGTSDPDSTSGCCVSDDRTECYCAVVSGTALCEEGFESTPSCTLSSLQCPDEGETVSSCD